MKLKSKELKEIVKHYVRECLTEVLAEMKIESLVEHKIQQSQGSSNHRDVLVPPSSLSSKDHFQNLLEQRKDRAINKLRIPENEWNEIYESTAKSNNPILNSTHKTAESNPIVEHVSENDLAALGLLRDYSHCIPDSKPTSNETLDTKVDNSEWEELMEKRRQMLRQNIKGA